MVGKEKTGQVNKGRSVSPNSRFFLCHHFNFFGIQSTITICIEFPFSSIAKACTSERSNPRKTTFKVTFSVNCSYLKLLLTAVTIWSHTAVLSLF